MPVGLQIKCDGCERHYNVPAEAADEVVDLSASEPDAIWLEVRLGLPNGWHARGGSWGTRFEVFCPDHAVGSGDNPS